MSRVIKISKYKETSQRVQLKALYTYMDNHSSEIGEANEDEKMSFFYKMQGNFFKIFRLHQGYELKDFSESLNLSQEDILLIEDGLQNIDADLTKKFLDAIKATREFNVFLEKIEECLNPGLKESRKSMADTLLLYGYRFSDASKYEEQSEPKVIHFKKSHRPK